MNPDFHTSPEQVVRLARYVANMSDEGVPSEFCARVLAIGQYSEPLFLMVEHWAKSQDAVDREEALADMDDMLDDEESVPHRPEHRPYVRFTDLAKVTTPVVEHKKRLREIIDKHGGVTAVARLAGIPQPSLSRMLNSASMPRRATLYRIANALDLSEPEIVGEFVR